MDDKKNKISLGIIISILIVSILVVVIAILGIYIFSNTPKNVKRERLDGGNVSLTYTDDLCGLSITNVGYLTDKQGKSLNSADLYFDFSVAVNIEEATNIDYEIALVPDKSSTIDSKYVKVYLEKQKSGTYSEILKPNFIKLSENISDLGSPKGSMVLHSEKKTSSSSDNYRLRLWVSNLSEVELLPSDIYTAKIVVNGKAS